MRKRSEVRARVEASSSIPLGPVGVRPSPSPPNVPLPKHAVTNAFWAGNYVVTLTRQPDGTLRQTKHEAAYVCYLRDRDLTDDLRTRLRSLRHIRAMTREGEWWRVQWHDWKVLRKACDHDGFFDKLGLKTYEADLHPVRRYLVDHAPKILQPRRGYYDLETDSRQRITEALKGKARVLCWSLVRQDGTKVASVLAEDSDDAERELLREFWEEVADVDALVAWGDFDQEVIRERSIRLGVTVVFKRWLWVNHLELFRRMNMNVSESGDEKQSMALESVSQALLGEGKVGLAGNRTWDYWERGGRHREALVQYNVRDADLLRRIEEKTGYLDLHETVCEECTTLPDSRGAQPTNFVEGYLLRLGKERGVHFKTHYLKEGVKHEQFEGAYVMEPTRLGVIEDVHVADFASLYPSIIITFNLSPETLTPIKLTEMARPSYLSHLPPANKPCPPGHVEIPGTGAVFSLEQRGILPEALDNLIGLRSVWKKRKDAEPPGTPAWKEADRRAGGYKIIANSFYGVQGSMFSRFYEREVAESVTLVGQWLIKVLIGAAEERGWHGLYGDTDSVFVEGCTREQFGEFVQWCNAVLWPRLLDERNIPIEWRRIKLAYEKAFRRLVMTGKKRYAGAYTHYGGKDATADSKPEIKGLEYKRGDTLRMARAFQLEVIMDLLNQDIDADRHEQRVRRWQEHVLKETLSIEDITLSKRMAKDFSEYKRRPKKDGTETALPAHVALAERLAKQGVDVRAGDKVQYIVADASCAPMQVVSPDEYLGKGGGKVDRYYLWEQLVYPPTARLLEAAIPGRRWKALERVRPGKRRIKVVDADSQVLLFG